MRLLVLTFAIVLVYALNASADEQDHAKSCTIVLAGQTAAPVSTEVLTRTRFVSGGDEELLPQTRADENYATPDLGRVVQVKDYDRISQGQLVFATSKGYIANVSPLLASAQRYTGSNLNDSPVGRLVFEVPFAKEGAQIMGVKPTLEVPPVAKGVYRSRQAPVRRVLVYSRETAKVILRHGLSAELPNSARIIEADFTGGHTVTAVFKERLRVYNYRDSRIAKEVAAQSEFSAAAVHSASGKVVAIDGHELVIFDGPEQRRVLTTLEQTGGANVVWSHHGSRFYLRQGSLIKFFESSGEPIGELQLSSTLMSMAWDASDSLVAFSTPNETIVYNLMAKTSMRIAKAGNSWCRVAWSENEGILLTLGIEPKENKSWIVQTWNPVTGEELPLNYELPVIANEPGHPYLSGIRGQMSAGTFRFYVLRQNGQFSDVVQVVGKPSAVKPTIIVPSPEQRRRFLN